MAKSCPHPDHSEPNEKEKRKKSELEEEESVEERDSIIYKTCKVNHLKHSWFEKGQDMVVVHIYMKHKCSQLVDVNFQENSVDVKIKTSAQEVLKLHPGCDENTTLEWHLLLRKAIDVAQSKHKLLRAMLELQLKKKTNERWGSLEMPSYMLNKISKVMENGPTKVSMTTGNPTTSTNSGKDENIGSLNTMETENEQLQKNDFTANGRVKKCHRANGENFSEDCCPNKPPSAPPPPPLVSPATISSSTGVMGGSNAAYNGMTMVGDEQISSGIMTSVHDQGRDSLKGAVSGIHIGYTGLENLGNTCYLNSIVQCLVNTRKLRDYFLDGRYKQEINTENPLGTGGKLAMSFGSLMKNIWSGKDKYIAPQKLKMIVGEKVCQFRGFMQHDAQEFMAFLLDGLHEDLNRVMDKPYTKEVEGGGRPDAEVAAESWKRHKSRNDSVIVDLFQGQLKSKLTCPDCHKISITFDPFMNLSVPLPKEQKVLPIVVFFQDPSRKPLKIMVKVAQDGAIEQLTAAVERKTGISVNNMRVYEAFRGKFHRFFEKGCSLSTVVANDLIIVAEVLSQEEAGEEVYEVRTIQRLIYPHTIPSHCGSCDKTPDQQEALRRCTNCFRIGYCNQSCQKNHWSTHKKHCKRTLSFVGVPFVMTLPASKATFKALTEVAAAYASYSVNICSGTVAMEESDLESDCVCKTQGETTKNEPTVTHARTCYSASSPSASSSSDSSGDPETYPQFYFKPVTASGEPLTGPDGVRLQDHGNVPLDLADKCLSLDWRNHPRMKKFVTVSEKKLDCTVDESCRSDILTDSYSCTLQECLELFTEPETLSDTDAWFCPRCKKHREATKQMSVWRLPEVLVIHLKRFSFRNILFRDKITKLVDFPIRGLDMSPFSLGKDKKESCLYDLFAVTNHSGTVNYGHYTSYGRLPNGSVKDDGLEWRYFDDKNVSSTNETRVQSKYAYVLFYQRRAKTFSPNLVPELKADCNASLSRPVLELKAERDTICSSRSAPEVKTECDAISSSRSVPEVKSEYDSISSPRSVPEVKPKCNATDQEQKEAEAVTAADTVERNSSKGENESHIKKESEKIPVIPINGVSSEAHTQGMETRFCGDGTTEGFQANKQGQHSVNLEDVDENDLD